MMKNEDVKSFLLKHRSKLNPEDYGFSALNRRVKGLRREEVAQLAAVSVSWYTWLEQGRTIRISPAALKRIGKVLQLSLVEQEYLTAIVFGGDAGEEKTAELQPEIKRMVDALNPYPAFVRRENMDLLYWNKATEENIFNWSLVSAADRNSLKLMFVSQEYKQRIHDWEKAAKHTLASFRAYYASSSSPENFEAVIQDLTARSDEFNKMWNYHDVGKMGSGKKVIIDRNGQLNPYTYSSLQIENAPDTYLICYMPENRD